VRYCQRRYINYKAKIIFILIIVSTDTAGIWYRY